MHACLLLCWVFVWFEVLRVLYMLLVSVKIHLFRMIKKHEFYVYLMTYMNNVTLAIQVA